MSVKILFDVLTDRIFIEKFFRNEFLLFQEPDEYQTSNQADYSFMIVFSVIFSCRNVIWKFNFTTSNYPSVPFR